MSTGTFWPHMRALLTWCQKGTLNGTLNYGRQNSFQFQFISLTVLSEEVLEWWEASPGRAFGLTQHLFWVAAYLSSIFS